jgi:N-acetyl-gamma-glutamyl-phosphate reductase
MIQQGMKEMKIRAGIFGGSGYGGAELLRILLFHPDVEIALVTANEHAGKRVSDVHRNLQGLTDLEFLRANEDFESTKNLDCVFLALPHGQALEVAPRISRLSPDVKVVDLSGDFRLDDAEEFAVHYGREHTATDLQKEFVYGLTEVNRERIAGARLISNPGCFATATLLGLAPLVASDVLRGDVVVDSKTGSSGSGAKPAANTHHPQRSNSFYAYKPFKHQHVPEIEQTLRAVGDWTGELVFMTHSLPVSRGIFSSIYAQMSTELTSEAVRKLYADYYRGSFFVRLVDGSPDINWVKTTNFCDIGFAVRGRHLVVFTAIDNLVKGAAGQAVQNMNLMFGIDEKTGLVFPGSNP